LGSHIFIIASISNVFAGLLGSGIEAVMYKAFDKKERITYGAAVNVVDEDYFSVE